MEEMLVGSEYNEDKEFRFIFNAMSLQDIGDREASFKKNNCELT